MKNPPAIIVQLIHIEGPMKGQIQDFFDPEILIGRHPACHVQFPKDLTTISRYHAKITREGNRFKLTNQGANGTLLNGKNIEEVFLKDGDVLTITENGPKVSFLTEMREDVEAPPSVQNEQTVPPLHQPSPPSEPETPPTPPVASPAPTPQPHHQPEKRHPPSAMQPLSQPGQTPKATPVPPKPESPHEMSSDFRIKKVQAPLIIQFGPTLRSFNVLPITIGKGPAADFVLDIPPISEQHARIFYQGNQYWVKDLTGQQMVTINAMAIQNQAPINPDDQLSLSPSGPRFRFLGGGRLAEIEESPPAPSGQEKSTDQTHEDRPSSSAKNQADKIIKGAKNVWDKFLQR